jgi:hypothetical protein
VLATEQGLKLRITARVGPAPRRRRFANGVSVIDATFIPQPSSHLHASVLDDGVEPLPLIGLEAEGTEVELKISAAHDDFGSPTFCEGLTTTRKFRRQAFIPLAETVI